MPGRNWQRACYNQGLLCGGSGEEGRDRSRNQCDTERIRGRPRRDPATLKRTENRNLLGLVLEKMSWERGAGQDGCSESGAGAGAGAGSK